MNHKSSELKRVKQNWALLLLLGAGLTILYGALIMPGSEDALRRMIRISGRISALVFSLAFAASSLLRLFPSQATFWLRTNRRQVGLLFAWSQLLHLLGLVALGQWYPDPFLIQLSAVALAGGGLAYFFTFALAATSNDRAVSWLGHSRWQRFHQIGSWWIWIILVQTITVAVWFVWVPLFGAAFLRVQSASRARRKR